MSQFLIINKIPGIELKEPITLKVVTAELPSSSFDFYGRTSRKPMVITCRCDSREHSDIILKWHYKVFSFSTNRIDFKSDDAVLQDDNDDYRLEISLIGLFPITYKDYDNLTFESNMTNKFKYKPKRINNCLENITIKNTSNTLSEALDKQSCLSWDEYFMNMAILASFRSKDTTKVGAVITCGNKILGVGYNGFVKGINESLFPTTREADNVLDTKYPFIIHAEANALLNTTVFDISGSKVYVTLFPCCHCVKLLLQKDISEVVYLSDKHHDDSEYVASRKLLDAANVKARQYNGRLLLPTNFV